MSHNVDWMIARKMMSMTTFLFRKLGKKKIIVIAGPLMVTLEVTHKTMRTTIEVMVIDLKARNVKEFLSRGYNLQEKDKIAVRILLFGKK